MNAVSLFSGCGGMDLGVKQAGYNVRACVEIDHHCCESLRSNIDAGTHVIEADIRDVDPHDLMESLYMRPGDTSLLFGGSPCQSFSQIGKQMSLSDDRGPLLFQITRFAEVLKPKAILVEQVKGLLSAKDANGVRGGVYKALEESLEELGYTVTSKVVLAANYGVPQLRERVFVVALHGRVFRFPEATHGDVVSTGSLLGIESYTTVGDALKGLPAPVIRKSKDDTLPLDSHYDVTPARDRERIHGVPEGTYLASQRGILPDSQICRLGKKDTTKFLRTSRSRPANTLRGGEIFYHPTEDRYLTPREYMRIHGYPDSYLLKGPIRGRSGTFSGLDQHRQVGNSVPPPVAKMLASEIMTCL